MEEKWKALGNYFKEEEKYIILFSGGFDSSCVLSAALETGAEVIPVWIDNGFNRATEDEISHQAHNLGTTQLNILQVQPVKSICSNPVNRCYLCKKDILSWAERDGYKILDGTTTDDLGKYRPGLKALEEYEVGSPLAENGINTQMAVAFAKAKGADPEIAELESCLATRFKYQEKITPERLDTIKKIERLIIDETGDYNVRCRFDGPEHIRIEVKKEESYRRFSEKSFRERLVKIKKDTSLFICLDLLSSRPNEYDKTIN